MGTAAGLCSTSGARVAALMARVPKPSVRGRESVSVVGHGQTLQRPLGQPRTEALDPDGRPQPLGRSGGSQGSMGSAIQGRSVEPRGSLGWARRPTWGVPSTERPIERLVTRRRRLASAGPAVVRVVGWSRVVDPGQPRRVGRRRGGEGVGSGAGAGAASGRSRRPGGWASSRSTARLRRRRARRLVRPRRRRCPGRRDVPAPIVAPGSMGIRGRPTGRDRARSDGRGTAVMRQLECRPHGAGSPPVRTSAVGLEGASTTASISMAVAIGSVRAW